MNRLLRLAARYRMSALPFLLMGWLLLSPVRSFGAEEWQGQVRAAVGERRFSAGLAVVDHRLAEAPDDLEAHTWRGRILAWTGHWDEAESEYKLVLAKFPNDIDVLTALADVLVWQRKYEEGLTVLDRAQTAEPRNPEIQVRRGRVLALLQRSSEARKEYETVLTYDPENRTAIGGLADLPSTSRYELRIGEETDFFSFTDNAQLGAVTLSERWNAKWTTAAGLNQYHLFGENAVRFWADAAFHFKQNNWLRVLGGGANPQDVVAEGEALLEYGHAFRFPNPLFKGLESSYQDHSLWYRGATVVALNTTQTVYLPRGWNVSLSIAGARTRLPGGASEWVPSGSTRVVIPVAPRLSASLLFAVGTENFAHVDQIGRFSARTYGGGLRYRFAERQDVSGFVAVQDREHGQRQTSLEMSYGIRF